MVFHLNCKVRLWLNKFCCIQAPNDHPIVSIRVDDQNSWHLFLRLVAVYFYKFCRCQRDLRSRALTQMAPLLRSQFRPYYLEISSQLLLSELHLELHCYDIFHFVRHFRKLDPLHSKSAGCWVIENPWNLMLSLDFSGLIEV